MTDPLRWPMMGAMAKGPSRRAREPALQAPPPVRIEKQSRPARIDGSLKDLLSAAGRVRQPGGIEIYSGVAQAAPRSLHAGLPDSVLPGWGWERWWIDAPPPGSEVLWLTLELASQWWHWDSCIGPKNDSDHYKYADFGIHWHWMLLPDQYYVPGAPASMQDSASYEFYASKAPGASTWTAWWVYLARGVTLTPQGKESDPNALALLLRTEQNGLLHFMFAYEFPWERVTFNGVEASCYTIDGGPRADSLHYSMAISLPRRNATLGDFHVARGESPESPKPLRRVRPRRS